MFFASASRVLPSRTQSLMHTSESAKARNAIAIECSKLLRGIPLLILGSLFASHAQVQTNDRPSGNDIRLTSSAAGVAGKAISPAKDPPAATYLRTPLSFEPN